MSSIIRATTTSGLQIAPDNSGSLQLQTNGTTTAVTIDTSQNVGIGTTSPGTKLDIVGAGNPTITLRGSDGAYTSILKLQAAGGGSSVINATGASSDALIFQTTSTERMRIDSSGNLLVSTTTTTGNGAAFQVAGSGGGMMLRIAKASEGTAHQFVVNSSVVGTIYASPSSTAYNTSSDYRLKENIVPMTGALNKVAQLKPVTYTWKANGEATQGFIAHELQEVVPDCVTGEKDAVETYTDEDGIEQTRPVYQGIDTSFLVATLTAAIQEQQTIINDLKARIETLEAK
jgi:hypothetical protein